MLTKLPQLVFIPGTPEIPHSDAWDECRQPPPGGGGNPGDGGYDGGGWRVVCTPVSIFLGWDYGPATSWNPGPFPKAIYQSYQVCRTEWVS